MRVLAALLLAALASTVTAQAPPTETGEITNGVEVPPVPNADMQATPDAQAPGAPTPSGCHQGSALTEVLLPQLQDDLNKFTALNWPHYEYNIYTRRFRASGRAEDVCPLTVSVQNGFVAEIADAPDAPIDCKRADERERAALQQVTVPALLGELINRTPEAPYLCWEPAQAEDGSLGAHIFHGTGRPHDDSEVYIYGLKQTARRRLQVFAGAAVGALTGCIAGAIFAGNCGGGAAAGATVGAIDGAIGSGYGYPGGYPGGYYGGGYGYGGYGPYGPPGPYGPYPPPPVYHRYGRGGW